MPLSRIHTFAERHPEKYFWWLVLPIQSILFSAYTAPMYGFNALISPINEIFAPDPQSGGWPGAVAGSLILSVTGFGALANSRLIKLAGKPVRLFVALNILTLLFFNVGALACILESEWLLMLGFAVPVGFVFGNLFALCMAQVLGWAQRFDRAGLQSGVIGLFFGLWGGLYSYFAPWLANRIDLEWLLAGTGFSIVTIGLIAAFIFVEPPKSPGNTKAKTSAPKDAAVELKIIDILKLAPFWIFFIFFMLFLTPGFGFKIIVQELSTKVFHANAETAAIMAVAFLTSYGLSRLIFGILSDKFHLKLLYLIFAVTQMVCLLVAAIILPHLQSVVIFTILMCMIGATFAAGKCIWMVLLLKLYGPVNYNKASHVTLSAYGLAGFIGPITLNFALQESDIWSATSGWLYVMSGALFVCAILILMLRRVDYTRFIAGKTQQIRLVLRSHEDLDRF